jgi:hypothetical protein
LRLNTAMPPTTSGSSRFGLAKSKRTVRSPSALAFLTSA